MNSWLWRAGALSCTFVLSVQTLTFASFVDPDLQDWMNERENRSFLISPTKEVLLYVEDQVHINRSGEIRSFAVENEKISSISKLGRAFNEITPMLGKYSKSVEYFWAAKAISVHLDRVSLRRLSKSDALEAILPNRTFMLDEPIAGTKATFVDESEYTYGLQQIHAPEAWNQGLRGNGVVVGVIDSGIADDHPDLLEKVVLSKDFTSDGHTYDRNSHGTHVAGTIVGGNASGTHIGVAPNAKLIVAKIFDDRGSTDLKTILRAMEWMLDPDGNPDTDDAPRVVSNSWGASLPFILGFRNIIQTWRRFQIFPNFAAGNSGGGIRGKFMSIGAPASYIFSFAVGAVDSERNIASFSSRGPMIWFKAWNQNNDDLSFWEKWKPQIFRKPDVSAPGVDVLSSIPGGDYKRYSGTSMATPHMAGVIALALQANADLSVEDLMEILETSTLDRGKRGKDNKYGHGIIQADLVVEKALEWTGSLHSSFQDKDPNSWGWAAP